MKTTVLHTDTSADLTKRIAIYKEDRLKARILFMNLGAININKVVMFEYDDSNFSIVTFNKRYNISKRNIMYSSESKEIIINCSGNKIMVTRNNGRGKTTKYLLWELDNTNVNAYPNSIDACNTTNAILLKKYPQLRFLNDFSNTNSINSLLSSNTGNVIKENLSISSILKHKLYSPKKCLAYLYKTQWDMALKLINLNIQPKEWKIYSEYVIATNIPDEINFLWSDLMKLARTLNRKINISWSEKRIKLTHDKWAKELNLIILEANNRPLVINPLFRECADKLNIKLIETTKELAQEGINREHCVGSYVHRVESGNSAIFKVEDYTLELVKENNTIRIGQFKGLRNCNAPDSLFYLINQEIYKLFPNTITI